METDEKRRGKDAAAAALSGGHLCHVCGHQYPNPHPSAKLRRSHRKHCGKAATATATAAVVEEAEEERNARQGTMLVVAGKGGEVEVVEGESEANGGAALMHGSASESEDAKAVAERASSNGTGFHHVTREINENGQNICINTGNTSPDDKVLNSELSKNGLFNCSSNSELLNKGSGAQLPISCNNGSQNEVAKYCSELAPTTVTNPAKRNGSFDEYQDAPLFLHQSDLEDSALPNSEFPAQINNLNTVLSGPSAAGNENSLGTNGLSKEEAITKDSCSGMDFTFEDMMQRDVVEQVIVAEENPSVQKTSGFTEDEVCNKQIDPEVPTEDQFHKSTKHAVLPRSQTSCAKNTFDLDDDRNDDLFELPTNSCYLVVPSAVSREEVDSALLVLDQLTVSNQTRMSEVQDSRNSNDTSSSGENGHPNGPSYIPGSSSTELMINTCLGDAPLNHHLQEYEAHTNGISFVSYQVAPMECHSICTQDTSAIVMGAEENTQREAKKVTADTAAKMNEVQHCNVEEKRNDNTKEVSVLQRMSNLEENKLNEDPNTKEMNADDLEGKWQADDSTTEKMNAIVCTDNFEEMYAQYTREKEVIAFQCTEKVDENKQRKAIVGQDGDSKMEGIAVTGGRLNSGRIRVTLKVLLAEVSAENKVNKPSAKERVLSFGRRVSKDDNSSAAKSGTPKSGCDDCSWDFPAKLPRKDTDKSSKGRKQPWMPFTCCHSVR